MNNIEKKINEFVKDEELAERLYLIFAGHIIEVHEFEFDLLKKAFPMITKDRMIIIC